MFVNPGAFTATASTSFARFLIANSDSITAPTGTTPIAASLWIAEPNLIATGTINIATSLYINGAPTEGGDNAAIWVASGDVVLAGAGALATNATTGFVHIPTCAGTPTGVPANTPTGAAALVFDSTNNKLYVYDGGWVDVTGA